MTDQGQQGHQGTRRAQCPRCLRPLATCLCAAVHTTAHQVQVLILMHPLEQRQAKGTGRLLHLCLPGSRLLVGEQFAPELLHEALTGPWCDADRAAPRRALLLYPATAASAPCAAPPPLPPDWLARPDRLRLVVLDATWRKSRKMLWTHPALQALPRLALQDMAPSRYVIRKAHAAHQLSTLEATQRALQRLEPTNTGIAALGLAMQGFMAQQSAYWPAARSAMLDGTPINSQETP